MEYLLSSAVHIKGLTRALTLPQFRVQGEGVGEHFMCLCID